MRQASEHDVAHLVHLFAGGSVQHRVVVSVYGCPPGGHAVNQFAAIFQRNRYALRPFDRIDR